MVFCNQDLNFKSDALEESHNPYFNRWFSAIGIKYEKRLFWETLSQSLF